MEGNETNVIIRLTIPMVYGLLSVIGVSLVDAFFIGKLGTQALAAFGFIFPIIFFFNGIILGIANGASALSARAFGAGDKTKVRRITTDAIMLGFAITISLAVITYLLIEPLFSALGAPPDVMPLIREYMTIWLIGSPFVAFPMIGNNAMTAIGDTRNAANIMLSVLVFNSLFDPVFIFGLGPIPALGFRGAAIATLASRIFVILAALHILVKKENIIEFRQPSLNEIWTSWKEILYIGLPNALTNIILPLGFSVITHLAAQYGKEAVAALSVAERVEALGLSIMMALSASMSPFIGQNLGAQNYDRIKTGLRKGLQLSAYWGVILFVILFFFSEQIIRFFNHDPIVISHFKSYFHFLPFSYPFLGFMFITGTMLNVFKKPLHSAFLSVTRIFIAYVPLAFLFAAFFQVPGIFLAAMLANFIVAFLGYYLQVKYRKEVIGI